MSPPALPLHTLSCDNLKVSPDIDKCSLGGKVAHGWELLPKDVALVICFKFFEKMAMAHFQVDKMITSPSSNNAFVFPRWLGKRKICILNSMSHKLPEFSVRGESKLSSPKYKNCKIKLLLHFFSPLRYLLHDNFSPKSLPALVKQQGSCLLSTLGNLWA